MDPENSEQLLEDTMMKALLEEIQDEVPSADHLEDLCKRYFEAQGQSGSPGIQHEIEQLPPTRDAYLLTCGACGVRDST